MSRVRLIEALARKRGENKLAKEPTDIGSKSNLPSTLPFLSLRTKHLPPLPSSLCILTSMNTIAIIISKLSDGFILEGSEDAQVTCVQN